MRKPVHILKTTGKDSCSIKGSLLRSEGQNQGLKRESGREEERKKDSASERAGSEFSPEGLHDLPFSVFIALESVERERLQR